VTQKTKKLYRSRDEAQLAGICAGVAEYFAVDPTLVRLGALGALFVTGIVPGLLTYVAAWLLVPQEPAPAITTQPATEAPAPPAAG